MLVSVMNSVLNDLSKFILLLNLVASGCATLLSISKLLCVLSFHPLKLKYFHLNLRIKKNKCKYKH